MFEHDDQRPRIGCDPSVWVLIVTALILMLGAIGAWILLGSLVGKLE